MNSPAVRTNENTEAAVLAIEGVYASRMFGLPELNKRSLVTDAHRRRRATYRSTRERERRHAHRLHDAADL